MHSSAIVRVNSVKADFASIFILSFVHRLCADQHMIYTFHLLSAHMSTSQYSQVNVVQIFWLAERLA